MTAKPQAKPRAKPKAASTKPKAAPRKTGRPPKYTKELGERICRRIAAGESLVDILKDEPSVRRETVWDWSRTNPEFSNAYIQARLDQTRSWADQIVSIADDIQQDYLRDGRGNPVLDQSGKPIFIKESPQRTRQRIETRQWLIERINQKEYGQKQTVDVNMNVQGKDDAELLHDLRQAAERAGLATDDFVALMSGAATVN